MFNYEDSFGKQAAAYPQTDLLFEQNVLNQQKALIQHSLFQSMEEEGLIPNKMKRKCEYCFEVLQIDQYQNHLYQCQESCMLIANQKQKGHRITSNQDQFIRNDPLTQSRITCFYCNQYVLTSVIIEHQIQCRIQQYHKRKENFLFNIQNSQYFCKQCIWCTLKISESQQQNHQLFCKTKDKIYRQLISFQPSQVQFMAMWKIYQQSAFENLYYKDQLSCLMEKHGYSEEDLMAMSEFIEHQAPINIHFNLSKCIRYFLEDVQYRNAFETKKGEGTSYTQNRKQWQKYLFGDFYENCQPSQRVKYGFLNYANDKYGSKKCYKYGDSIIVLNDNVRKRCTIAHNRQYAAQEIVGTLKYSHAILLRFSEEQLKALYLASRGFEIDSSQLQNFKEVHIHGSIQFFRDVKCIYTSKQERDRNFNNVRLFQMKFGVKVLTFEELEAEQIF